MEECEEADLETMVVIVTIVIEMIEDQDKIEDLMVVVIAIEEDTIMTDDQDLTIGMKEDHLCIIKMMETDLDLVQEMVVLV